MDCRWRIQVNPGNKVNVEFSHFDLENVNVYESENRTHVCQYDYLEVIDDTNKGKYCNEAPKSFISRKEFIDVVFHTDNSATATGFRIEYATEGMDEKAKNVVILISNLSSFFLSHGV